MFIRMLTDESDLVIDPFGGSCITGAVAERMNRKWICCELDREYIEGAKCRFSKDSDSDYSVDADRSVSFEAYSPSFLLSESDAPLIQDGGSERPRKKQK